MSDFKGYHPDYVELLITHLLDNVFNDPKKLKKIALARLKVLDLNDVAYLLNKSEKTIRNWHKEQRYGFRMNEGPDGSLTMRWEDFDKWYSDNHKKPPPKL